MAQALNKTKRRIASVKSTKKITEAMELVATVKLKKFKNKMEANQFYVQEIEGIISHLFEMLSDDENLYIKPGKGDKNLVVVINSNLGLCASYNSKVFNFVQNNLDKQNDNPDDAVTENSSKLITSGAVYDTVGDIETLLSQL